MIINNYTGDRLNFGLAIETARTVHKYRNIKAITINDDCAIDYPRHSTGRRGLSGINLVIKIAGAMSARGYSVSEIYDRCQPLLQDRLIRTIGFSFHHHITNELRDIEIGYGIHGEPGIIKIERSHNFMPIIDVMIKKLKVDAIESDVILLVNNLGGASEFIFYHFIRNFLTALDDYRIKVIKVYGGKFLTSLGKEGIGVTLMEIKDRTLIDFLDDPINVPAKELFNHLEISKCETMNFLVPKKNHGDNVDAISGAYG
jgi:dihydroxyacetone kinase